MDSKQAVHLARQNRECNTKESIMFIIANNSIIAKVSGSAVAGQSVRYSSQRCEEAINASREWNLVNARDGKISNAAKWHKAWNRMEDCRYAVEINPGEYFFN